MEKSKFELLRNKEILAILDGDYEIEKKGDVRIAMPYLSGPDLCNLSALFGLSQTYACGSSALSRWAYLDNLLEYAIEKNKMSQLLSYMFSKENFAKSLSNLKSVEEIETTHKYIVEKVIEHIN